jgi:ComF family protein
MKGFTAISHPLCPLCGRPHRSDRQEDHFCGQCIETRPFYDLLRAPYLFEGAIMDAIHMFKYAQKDLLAEILGPMLAGFAKGLDLSADDALVVPVPLHPERLRQRGFNQSLLLARPLSKALGWELDFLTLRRTKETIPQTGLGKKERIKNVKGAFEVIKKDRFRKRDVVLVDDVATTGNTLNQCALALKSAGASKVFCLVLARASF